MSYESLLPQMNHSNKQNILVFFLLLLYCKKVTKSIWEKIQIDSLETEISGFYFVEIKQKEAQNNAKFTKLSNDFR